MKRIFLLSLVTLCLFSFQKAEAQVDLTLNPVGALFGDFNIGADFGISENFSVEAQVGFGTPKIDGVKGRNIPVNVVGKYYFNPKQGVDRFYADVFLRFISRNWEYDDSSANANFKSTRFGLGFGLGYKIVSAKGFVFDLGFGVGRALVTNNKYESGGIEEDVDWGNVILLGKFGIGYRFGGSNSK